MISVKPIDNNTEFLIGIDFGHGETSACQYSLKKKDDWQDIDIMPGEKVVKSAIAITREEGHDVVTIGDAAWQKAPGAKAFRVSFKKKPSLMNEEDREIMRLFMKGVYDNILNCNTDFKIRDHRVVIARPSSKDWDPEAEIYAEIAIEAGLPVVGIQKESRAAFFRARTQPDARINNHVKDGVLIVDFGSSTIDFTYLREGLKNSIDDGYDLGASYVEKAILKYALSHPKDSDSTSQKIKERYCKDENSIVYNQLLLEFRNSKEIFYRNKNPMYQVKLDYGFITAFMEEPIEGNVSFYYKSDFVEKEILNNYIDKVRQKVEYFRDVKLGQDNKVVCVYLTGGASRMNFVRSIMMDVFSLDEAHVPGDNQPSLIVSQGVASLSVADFETKSYAITLEKKVNKLLDEFNWNKELTSIIKDCIKDRLKSEACTVMGKYKRGEIYEYHDQSIYGFWDYNPYAPVEYPKTNHIRNVDALRNAFKSHFNTYKNYDFSEKCNELIKEKLVTKILNELKPIFGLMHYEEDLSSTIKLSGLSAFLTQEGINTISKKFCDEGEGHILFDAVAKEWITMGSWNLTKDRYDSDREQHYRDYSYSIYSDWAWENIFFKGSNIQITGIDSAKKAFTENIRKTIDDCISYARLAVLIK